MPDYWGAGYPWLSIADMGQGLAITRTKEQITSDGARGGRLVPGGTVLLSFKLSIGKVAITTSPLYTNEAIAALPIRDPSQLDPRYLMRALEAMNLATGSNRAAMGATLNLPKLRSIEIPVPSKSEQGRIASILDQADALRAKRRQVLAHLDALTQAIFHDMFGNPLGARGDTPRAKLGDLARVATGGSPPRSNSAYFNGDVEWLKSDNLGGIIASKAEESLSLAGVKKSRVAPSGSVLVTCIAGSAASIGKCSLVDRNVAFNQQINAVMPSAMLDPVFLLAQLKTSPDLVRRKSAGGMKSLVNKSAFEEIEVLCPRIELQREFARVFGLVQDRFRAGQTAAISLEALFASLQSRAFRGEL